MSQALAGLVHTDQESPCHIYRVAQRLLKLVCWLHEAQHDAPVRRKGFDQAYCPGAEAARAHCGEGGEGNATQWPHWPPPVHASEGVPPPHALPARPSKLSHLVHPPQDAMPILVACHTDFTVPLMACAGYAACSRQSGQQPDQGRSLSVTLGGCACLGRHLVLECCFQHLISCPRAA